MTSTQSATPVPRQTGRPATQRLFLTILLATVLAACQSTQSVLPDDEGLEDLETLAIIVSPMAEGSGDLDGETVRGTVVVSIPAQGWMKEVRFFVDGERRHTVTSTPFEYMLDTTLLADGPHLLAVEARMSNGRVRVTESATFTVSNESEPTDPEPTEPGPTEPGPDLGGRASPTLRGDPSFDAASLSGEAGIWYERILESTKDGTALGLAGRDDVYTYGRTLNAHVQTVLLVFRLTGDLALLDHVDEIAERMRSELRDGWRGTNDGTDGTKDGYLNWVYRNEPDSLRGKDTHKGNEMKTHAMVAAIAYALDVNRDLTSPSGRAYGKHADQWRDYLVNHFEAKWRERTGRPTEFPFILRPHTHTYYSWMRWHHYMGLLTGEPGYRIQAEHMATVLSKEVREVSTPNGIAYVFPRSVLAEGGTGDYLMPTTYARYVYADVIEMHFEGFGWYASNAVMNRFALAFSEFVMDEADPVRDGFASDIGGGVERGGLRSDTWSRLSAHAYQISSYAMIGPWDATGRIADATEAIYAAYGDNNGLLLAAGAFSDVWFEDMVGVDAVASSR